MAEVRVLSGGIVVLRLSKSESNDLASAVADVVAAHIDEIDQGILEAIIDPAAAEAAPDLVEGEGDPDEVATVAKIRTGIRHHILRSVLTGVRRELRYRHITAA